MKKIITILFFVFASSLFFVEASFAQIKKTGPVTNLLPVPIDPVDDGPGGGGGGGGPIYYGGLITYNANYAQYQPGADGEIALLDINGPQYTNPFFFSGLVNSTNFYWDLYHMGPNPFNPFSGGVNNDEARSATFSGNLAGLHFEFYDSPSMDKTDDWTEVTFKQNPPVGYAYFLWTFEAPYTDQYVTVRTHYVNGLDGKVSYMKYNQTN